MKTFHFKTTSSRKFCFKTYLYILSGWKDHLQVHLSLAYLILRYVLSEPFASIHLVWGHQVMFKIKPGASEFFPKLLSLSIFCGGVSIDPTQSKDLEFDHLWRWHRRLAECRPSKSQKTDKTFKVTRKSPTGKLGYLKA